MAAVLMLVRARLRRRWRSWLALAVLLGVAGGVVLTAAAGARRTDTAYPRFLDASRADDLLVALNDDSLTPAVQRLPEVADATLVLGFNIFQVSAGGRLSADPQRVLAPTDHTLLATWDTGTLVAGRMPDPSRADEVLVNPTLADLWHLHAGSTVTLRAFSSADQNAFDPSKPVPAKVGRNFRFTVTGILVGPDDVIADPRGAITRLYPTVAFATAHRDLEGYSAVMVRLRHGSADLARFETDVNRIAAAGQGQPGPGGGTGVLINPRSTVTARVQRAVQPDVVALWLFAALLAATTLLVVGQAVSRQLQVESDDDATLRALGISPGQLVLAALLRVAVVSLAAALLAVAVAVAASPLMPIGPVRAVEPQPGVSLDPLVLGVGAAAMVALLILRALPSAWRLARPRPAVARGGPGQVSRLAGSLAQAGLPPSTVVGVRLALEPGRGRTSVPVRSSMAGTAVAVAAMVAALAFAASLGHLVATPRLYGWSWNLQVDNAFNPQPSAQLAAIVDRDREVSGYALGVYGRLEIGGQAVPAVGIDQVRGDVFPTLLQGRAPQRDGEIVLGDAVLGRIHRGVGDTVEVGGAGGHQTMRVVGRAVFPVLGIGDFEPTSLGVGAALTVGGLYDAGGSDISTLVGPPPPGAADVAPRDLVMYALVRFAPGVDPVVAQRHIEAQVPPLPVGPTVLPVIRPTEITGYDQVQATPLLLAALLGLLGVGTLAHALISGVRRRGRDLAVLKTLGFVRRQVWSVVAWQATTLVVVALAVGIPVGIAAGRWAWAVFASQLNVVDEPVLPWLPVLLAIPAAVLLANLLAAIPGRVAARVQPALLLRTE